MLCLSDCYPRASRNEVAPEENETRTTKIAHIYFLSVFFLRIPVLLPNAPPIVKQSNTRCGSACVFFFRLTELRAFVLVICIQCGHSGGGVVERISRGHEIREWTAGELAPTTSALIGTNACTRRPRAVFERLQSPCVS